ncbi:MAG: 5-formyltetrahydrofolate cyclo-ligase [bacterium]
MDETKTAMRLAMRAQRRALAADQLTAAAAAVAAHVQALAWFRVAPALVAYVATDNEVSTEPLLATAHAAGKRLYLPRLTDGAMTFAEHRLGTPLRIGAFGIPQPQGDSCDTRDLADAMAVLPLLAWDDAGGRVGRGGGHYDRAFAGPHRPRWLIGLGYAFQQVPHVPRDLWDVRLDGVVTEQQTVTCWVGDDASPLTKEDPNDHDHDTLDTGQPRAGGGSGLRAGRRAAQA